MLGKLLKHEMKALAHWFVPLYIGVGIAMVLFGIGWTINLAWDNEIFSTIITMSLLFLFMATLAVISLGTFAIIIIQFYKTMVSDEGYLTHTLPVTVDQLLISKGLAGFIWNVLAIIAMALVILFAIFLTLITTGAIDSNFWMEFVEMWNSLRAEIKEGIRLALGDITGSLILLGVEFIVLLIISGFSKLYLVYLSMALGQSVKGHKFLWSTIFYICILIGTGMISQIVTTVVMLGYGISTNDAVFESLNYFNFYTHGMMLTSILLSAAYLFGSYFLSRYLLKNRLNLD